MNNRLRIFVILIGTLLVAATFTFPEWRPLLTREIEAERFPGLSSEQQSIFQNLEQQQQLALQTMIEIKPTLAVEMARAITSPDVIVSPEATMEVSNPTIVASGRFTEVDTLLKGEGTATIYRMPDNSLVLRLTNFRVTNGPDLFVVMTRNPQPRNPEEPGDPNQVGTDYINLGALQGNAGEQLYNMPAEVDLSRYRGVVIYSVPFETVFTSAAIR